MPLNIAEGCGCTTTAEFSRFLGCAYRSLKELVTALELCARLYPERNTSTRAGLVDEATLLCRKTRSRMLGREAAHES